MNGVATSREKDNGGQESTAESPKHGRRQAKSGNGRRATKARRPKKRVAKKRQRKAVIAAQELGVAGLDSQDGEAQALREQCMRMAADFDNYKKRVGRERNELRTKVEAELILDFLDVLDDMDRSLKAAEDSEDFGALREGIELTHQNFLRILERRGVSVIEAKGAEFDPVFHEALMQVEDEAQESNTVIDEHQRGYKLKERVLRPSKVIVSK